MRSICSDTCQRSCECDRHGYATLWRALHMLDCGLHSRTAAWRPGRQRQGRVASCLASFSRSMLFRTTIRFCMPSFVSAKPVIDSLANPFSRSLRRPFSSLCSSYLSSKTPDPTLRHWQSPRRAYSSRANPPSTLFNYTSGRWLFVLYMSFYGAHV